MNGDRNDAQLGPLTSRLAPAISARSQNRTFECRPSGTDRARPDAQREGRTSPAPSPPTPHSRIAESAVGQLRHDWPVDYAKAA